MLEVEMKFPIADVAPLEEKLRAAGARRGEQRQEQDQYFNAPDRDFAKTDEALRIRRIGEKNIITYKGPKKDLQTKTRTELEVPLQAGPRTAEDAVAVLTHLGYRFVAVIRKQRTIWHLERAGYDVEICLDRVQGVGDFVELEIVAAESSLDAARQAVLNLAQDLGLTSTERRSYLEMWLAKHHGA